MKAELLNELASLTLEEKNEAYFFLAPFVIPSEEDAVSSEVFMELEKRLLAHREDPTGSITLDAFKNRQFGLR